MMVSSVKTGMGPFQKRFFAIEHGQVLSFGLDFGVISSNNGGYGGPPLTPGFLTDQQIRLRP